MITLRKATLEDSIHLYVWRNHPSTRVMMRNTEEIPWEQHRQWLRDTLEDDNRHLLIGLKDGKPVGSVRFDMTGDEAEISVMTAPDRRGGGVGTELILRGTEHIFRMTDIRSVRAEVKTINSASRTAFERAGYFTQTLTEHEVILIAGR